MDISRLYKEYSNTIFHVCNKYLNDYELAKDAVHDVFIKAYQKSDQFGGQSKEISWLYRIAINHCIDILRVKKRRNQIIDMHRNEFWEVDREEEIIDIDSERLTKRILSESNESLREVASLYYFGNLSQDEIGEMFGLSRVAITKRLKRFRENALVYLKENEKEEL